MIFSTSRHNRTLFLLIAISIGVFLYTASMVQGPSASTTWIDSWDRAAAQYLGTYRNETLTLLVVLVTHLGDGKFLTPLVLLSAALLLWRKRRRAALLLLLSGATTSAVGPLLKIFFARARPDALAHLVFVDTFSFPSNHALGAAAIYLTLALQSLRAEQNNIQIPWLSTWRLWAAILLILAIDASRIYLGVHYFSDVLAGTCVGISIAAFFSLSAERN